MKSCLLLLLLLVFVSSQPMPSYDRKQVREEMLERRKKQFQLIAECILKSEEASEELKKAIEENNKEDMRLFFAPTNEKLNEKDHNIIRNCRKEMFKKMIEDRQRERRRDFPNREMTK